MFSIGCQSLIRYFCSPFRSLSLYLFLSALLSIHNSVSCIECVYDFGSVFVLVSFLRLFFLVLRMFHYCTITMEIAIECDTQRKRVRDRQGLSLNCLSILHTLEQCVSFHIVIISRLTGFRCLSNSTLIFPFLWLVFAPILSVPHFRCVPSSNPTKKMETANVEWHDRERKTSIRMKKKRNKSIPIFIWM